MPTIWMTHAFEANARAKGRPMARQVVKETHAFGVPELDASEAPVAFTVTRVPSRRVLAGPGAAPEARQELTYRLHGETYLRGMLLDDDASPLPAAALADAAGAAARHMHRWSDDPASWAEARWPGSGTAISRFAETDQGEVALARSTMAGRVASLRCIDGRLWAPCPPPAWMLDRNGDVSMFVPGLDARRVGDLASFAERGGMVDAQLVAGPLVPWHVGYDEVTTILGAEPGRPPRDGAEVIGEGEWPDGGLDAFRAYMLACDIDVQVSGLKWEDMAPAVRSALATVSARCRSAAGGGTSPAQALNEAAASLATLPALAERIGQATRTPLFGDVAVYAGEWAAARAREVALAHAPAFRGDVPMADFMP